MSTAVAEALPRLYDDDDVKNVGKSHDSTTFCKEKVPSLFSSFVDAFVDYVVGGQFLGGNDAGEGTFPSLSTTEEEDANFLSSLQPKSGAKVGLDADIMASDWGVVGGGGLRTWLPAPERLIAIGDIHGDIAKARAALRIANVIDENDEWVGGETVVVQVGDLLDRGGEEIKVLYLLEKLRGQAQRAGGNVHIMNGNHEIMNIEGDFRYATSAGLDEFHGWAHWYNLGNILKEKCVGLGQQPDVFRDIPNSFPAGLRARIAALRPGGPISSRFLANHATVLVVGSSVFVHGGLLPVHVEHGLDRINEEVSEWMRGTKGWRGPRYLHGPNALVWLRKFSDVKESQCDCQLLMRCLDSITGVKRMVVGHTIQQPVGLNAVCDNKVIRVDVGLSKGCGDGEPQVLEICGDKQLRVLSSRSPPTLLNPSGGATKETVSMVKKEENTRGLASLLGQIPKRFT